MKILEIDTGGIRTRTTATAGIVTVRLEGSAETPAMRALADFLARLHQTALDAKATEVVVDIRPLSFMNSTCFKELVSWVNEIAESPRERHYRVRFLADAKRPWQSRSLGALACFAADLIVIET